MQLTNNKKQWVVCDQVKAFVCRFYSIHWVVTHCHLSTFFILHFYIFSVACSHQGCGAGAQEILDGWSRSHTFFRWWSRSLKFGFRFKRVIQITQCFLCFLDQIVLEPEPNISRCWRRSQKNYMPGAGAWNLSTGSTALAVTHISYVTDFLYSFHRQYFL